MKKKRTNPRKIPATMADVKKAKEKAQEMETRLRRLLDYVESYSDDILDGRVSVFDILNTLEEEAGIHLAIWED